VAVALALAGALASTPPTVPVDGAQATAYGWSAPPECPDATAVRRTIEHYAARGLDQTGAVLHAADAEIVAEPGGYRLRLRLEVAEGTELERLLHDASCQVLAETAALMIAVTIDPSAVGRAPPPREPIAPTPTPAPKPAPAATAAPARDTPRSCDAGPRRGELRPCLALEAHAGMQLGLLPKIVGPGIGIAVALTWARLRVELGASHWFRRPARIADDPPAGGDLQLSAGSLGACARLGRRRVEVPLCGGGELGAMYGRGVGIDAPRTERVLWAAAWVGPRLVWVLQPRFVLLGGVDLVVPLARYRFEVQGLGVVHRVDPVGGRFRLGFGVRI
jgi:hypothetical protein